MRRMGRIKMEITPLVDKIIAITILAVFALAIFIVATYGDRRKK